MPKFATNLPPMYDLHDFLIPIDIHALNEEQVSEIINRIEEIHPKTIGFKGLSYKEGSDVTEKSQLLEIHDILRARGYSVNLGEGDVTLDWNGIKESTR